MIATVDIALLLVDSYSKSCIIMAYAAELLAYSIHTWCILAEMEG